MKMNKRTYVKPNITVYSMTTSMNVLSGESKKERGTQAIEEVNEKGKILSIAEEDEDFTIWNEDTWIL